MKVDEWTSEDVHTSGGGEFPPCAGLTSNALPEAQSTVSAESSQTGVSTRSVHILSKSKVQKEEEIPHWSRVWIRKLSGKEAIPVAKITVWALRKVKNLIHTITADNGKEFAKHEDIAQKLDINFYFCKPYHSWERGANENTNGLIRQYIPKGTDFSEVTNKRIKWIENNLNNRPRKRLGYLTPNEKFKQIINMNSVAFGT